jgi:hypothetical protein
MQRWQQLCSCCGKCRSCWDRYQGLHCSPACTADAVATAQGFDLRNKVVGYNNNRGMLLLQDANMSHVQYYW